MRLMYTASMAVILQCLGTAALAQAAPAPSSATALEEIVVTATRREVSLQRVPVAVTAVAAEAVAASGVTDVRSLTSVVPGFVGGRQNAAFLPVIRGVGSTGVSRNDESNIALYIDGVYQPDAAANIMDLVAIERVEVLRGPQGTIFGRNATGGLVNIITPDPKFEPHGKLSASYGRFKDANEGAVRGYFTTGLTDKFAVDLGVAVRGNDGYIKDLVRGGERGEARVADIRSKLLFQPTDKAKAVLTVGYGYIDDDSGNTFQPLGRQARGYSVPGTIMPTGPYQAALDIQPVSKIERWNMALATNFDLGPVKLETTTGYNKSRLTQQSDNDASPLLLQTAFSLPRSTAITQEIRLLSNHAGPLEWIAGVYGFSQRGAVDVRSISATGTTPISSRAKTTAYAGFAEGTYTLAEHLKATLGARYSTEDRTFYNVAAGRINANNVSVSADKWTYRGTLQYLFGMGSVYATYSTGFKSGVFNTLGTSPIPTRPENISAIEGGVKLEPTPWLRANLAVFDYDYSDLQVQARDPNSGVFLLQNAASAKIRGGEIELNAQATHDLSLRLAASYLDAKYDSFPAAQTFVPQANGTNTATTLNVSGRRMIRAPRYTFQLGADWKHQLNAGELGASVSVLNSARVYYDFANIVSQAPYTTVNGQVSFTPAGTRWRGVLWATNITDALVAQQITPGAFATYVTYEKPRRVGVTLEYSF